MLSLILLTLLGVALSHWLFEPLLRLITPVLCLAWLGWGLLAVVIWAFAGPERTDWHPLEMRIGGYPATGGRRSSREAG